MAITPFVSDIEMNQNIIYRACFQAEDSEPQNPKDGQYYLNKTDNRVYFYRTSDNEWHKIGDGIIYTAGNGIIISPEYVISIKEEITDQIDKNKVDIEDINKDINEISDTIVEMQQEITTNKNEISNIKTDVEGIHTEITAINDNLIDLQDQINVIDSRVSIAERNITTNANDISALQDRVTDTEANIQTNKNSINALDKRVTKNEEDIAGLKTELDDTNINVSELANKKLDKDFTSELLTDIEVIRKSVTDVSIKETKINPSTRTTSTNETILPLVDGVNSGLATPEMVITIADNTDRIEALEQQGGRFIGQSFATAAELKQFKITDQNVGDFTYVLDDEDHEDATTRYIIVLNQNNNQKEFKFAYVINYDPVGNFTQTEPGLILGKNSDGYVYAEADGSGSVVGWSNLKLRVTNVETDLEVLESEYNTFVDNDFKDVSDRLIVAEKDIDNLEKDIDDLDNRKADKDKLQSVITGISLKTSADSNSKNNIIDIMKTTYNALDDSSSTTNVRLPLASNSTAGLMKIEDRVKLDGIQDGAEVNQNAYSYIKVGENVIGATKKTDTLEFESGEGIKLTTDAGNKKLKIETTIEIPSTATWDEAGLQSGFDKEREDKMGQEVWEAVIDDDGNYTIDIKDFQGYLGNESHIYVRFMQRNTTKTPLLTIKSSTANYVLIDSAPIMQTLTETPKKKMFKDGSLLELVYKPDGKFYIVAGTGSGSGSVGEAGYYTQNGICKAIGGTIPAENTQNYIVNLTVYDIMNNFDTTRNITSKGATIFISITSDEYGHEIRTPVIRWMSESSAIEDDALSPDKVFLVINGLEWYLAIDARYQYSGGIVGTGTRRIYEYKIIDMVDKHGEEPEIETFSQESINELDLNQYTIVNSEDHNVMTVSGDNAVNTIVKLTREEFEQLREDKEIKENTIYNVTDDQFETLEIYTVINYNTMNPSQLNIPIGGVLNIKADANTNFVVNSKASSGIIFGGKDTYTLLCQEEGSNNGNIYYRTWYNGSWGEWKTFASANDPYVKSTDKSVENILTITQEEYDDLLLNENIDPKTLYNTVNKDGTGIVSRFNEYTDLSQIGIVGLKNMQLETIADSMSNNSVLHVPLSSTFTIAGIDATSGILEVVKANDGSYYASVKDGLEDVSGSGGSIKRTQLYNNATGTTGNITLSQTAADFSRLKIYYRINAEIGEEYTEVYSPNLKKVHISSVYEPTTNTVQYVSETFTISGINITRGSGTPFYIFRIEGEE